MRAPVLSAVALIALALPGCCGSGSSIAPEPSADASALPAAMRRPDPPPSAAPASPDVTPEQAIALVLATDEAREEVARAPSHQARITETTGAYYDIELSPGRPEETNEVYPSFRVERPSGRVLFMSLCQDQRYMDRDWMTFEREVMARIVALPEVHGYSDMLQRLSQGKVRMTMYAEQCSQAAPGSGQSDRIGIYIGERHESHTVRGLTFEVERAGFAITVHKVTEPMVTPYAVWRTTREAADYRRELDRSRKGGPR